VYASEVCVVGTSASRAGGSGSSRGKKLARDLVTSTSSVAAKSKKNPRDTRPSAAAASAVSGPAGGGVGADTRFVLTSYAVSADLLRS
jgi:hypothetical protein